MYCEKCRLLFEDPVCPKCRKSQGRQPVSDDLCFLIAKEPIWAELLKNVLQSSAIPYLTKSKLGIGMSMMAGTIMEQISFYVPYENLEAASDITAALFSAQIENVVTED